MASLVDFELPSLDAIVLAGALPIPVPQLSKVPHLEITFPDFRYRLLASIVDFHFSSVNESGVLIVRINIGGGAVGIIEARGPMIKGGREFQPDEAIITTELAEQSASAEFVASSLKAMLGLAGQVGLYISEVGFNLKFKFDLSLIQISQALQTRQRDYRLMVIERATGLNFLLPQRFSGEVEATIAFIYHAIVHRSFVWPLIDLYLPVSANEENLCLIRTLGQQSPMILGKDISSRDLLGETVSLGPETVIIEDGVINDFDKVLEELARDDHEVMVVIRSPTGQVKYELLEAPRLPDNPWDSNVQALIDLEPQLDAQLAELYHALAAATLADLTEEEKAAITARPELDDEAFFIPGLDGEND